MNNTAEFEYMDVDHTEQHSCVSESREKTVINNPNLEMAIVMVKNSIKRLRKPVGASFEDIIMYLNKNYTINMKDLKSLINEALETGVSTGELEKISDAVSLEKGASKRKMKESFKIK